MEMNNDFKLDVVSVRLVKEAPIFSDVKITTPEIATWLIGKYLCEMDREVLCVVNLKSDNTPINRRANDAFGRSGPWRRRT